LLDIRPQHTVEDRRLVQLVDEPNRNQQQPGAKSEMLGPEIVEVRQLDPRFASILRVRVLELDFRVEQQSVGEFEAHVDDRPEHVDLVSTPAAGAVLTLRSEVLVRHFSVPSQRNPVLGPVDPRRSRPQPVSAFLLALLLAAPPMRIFSSSCASTSSLRSSSVIRACRSATFGAALSELSSSRRA
jgi:hypothetical protein